MRALVAVAGALFLQVANQVVIGVLFSFIFLLQFLSLLLLGLLSGSLRPLLRRNWRDRWLVVALVGEPVAIYGNRLQLSVHLPHRGGGLRAGGALGTDLAAILAEELLTATFKHRSNRDVLAIVTS